jgi:hypothetical protein
MKRKVLVRVASFVLAIAALAVFLPSPALAATNRSSCFQNYYTCVNDAANLDGFWRRAAAGADCFVDLTACVRDAILN